MQTCNSWQRVTKVTSPEQNGTYAVLVANSLLPYAFVSSEKTAVLRERA